MVALWNVYVLYCYHELVNKDLYRADHYIFAL